MLSIAHDLVARATRYLLATAEEPALFTIGVHGRVMGSLMRDAGSWRIAWFDNADPRLANYAGPLDGDIDGLARVLGDRVGRPVEIASLPV